jgi:hypothetical protein
MLGPMPSISNALKIALGFIAIALFSGLSCQTIRSMPDNAIVLVDDTKHQFIAPPCVDDTGGLKQTTARAAYSLKYKPEPGCRDRGGFMQMGRSLTGVLFEGVGLLRPLASRWNEDGSWRW